MLTNFTADLSSSSPQCMELATSFDVKKNNVDKVNFYAHTI